jgi:hypothetical protein
MRFKTTYYGNDRLGYANFPPAPISVKTAIEKAQPYLDRSFALRSAIAEKKPAQAPIVQVTLSGSYYYVIKDVEPTPVSLVLKSVRVDAGTGDVIPPK